MGTMSASTVVEFMQKTASDVDLRERLEGLLGVGDGDISSAAELDAEEASALMGERGPKVVEFAAQQGFQFSLEDLVSVVEAFQKYQNGDLSDDEFAAAIGSAEGKDLSAIARPLKRLAGYLSKTYLGIELS